MQVFPERWVCDMRIRKIFSAAALGVAALGLGACAPGLHTPVSRYQAMPAAQGQTFMVVPGSGLAASGGLEFQRYAALVAQHLQARGYTPAADVKTADMVIQFDYGVDNGQTRSRGPVRPIAVPSWGDPSFRPLYPRLGYRSLYCAGTIRLLLRLWRYGQADPLLYRISQPYRIHIRQNVTKARCRRPRVAARGPSVSRASSRALSTRCSPVSRAATARRSGSPFPRRADKPLRRGQEEARPVHAGRAFSFERRC